MRSIVAAILCLALVGLTDNSTCLAAQQKTPPTGSASTSPSPATKAPTGSNQFTEESQAKAHCPSDTCGVGKPQLQNLSLSWRQGLRQHQERRLRL